MDLRLRNDALCSNSSIAQRDTYSRVHRERLQRKCKDCKTSPQDKVDHNIKKSLKGSRKLIKGSRALVIHCTTTLIIVPFRGTFGSSFSLIVDDPYQLDEPSISLTSESGDAHMVAVNPTMVVRQDDRRLLRYHKSHQVQLDSLVETEHLYMMQLSIRRQMSLEIFFNSS